MNQYVLILGCFDTKGEVFAFLRQAILAKGEPVLTINTGVMGTTADFPVDYESDVAARKANHSTEHLRKNRDRGHAIDVMGTGAEALVRQRVLTEIMNKTFLPSLFKSWKSGYLKLPTDRSLSPNVQ